MIARDGKLYADVTMREMLDRIDVTGLPMLAEIKRLYDENDRLRKLLHEAPEQAVEATLGRSECRFRTVKRFIDARRDRADMCECDRCGYRCARGFIQDERFKYCPNCGRKVVSE